MKRYVMLCSMFLFLFTTINVIAQDKVKVTDDKSKMKSGDRKEKVKDDKMKVKDGDMKVKTKTDGDLWAGLPYTATYSSNFVMGDPAHARMIVNMWKDWDDNALDRNDFWADTMTVYLSDGTVTKGKAANMEGAKKYRGGMTSAKSVIHAWVPLKSTDTNENWVAIWGTETDTWPDGKVETSEIHEIWRINKDGKIDLMRQFTAKPEKK